ncbi:MAG TPA: SIR2 family protein [Opitutaceae bacterium]|nr:SIR2 family protein [Opitutaceae bacterium]
MSDTVIIFGAGFSKDAGIPLLGDFVDTMLEIAIRRSCRGVRLSDEDAQIFQQAVAARNALDHYHGRANFNDRNIEDILSILTFNCQAGDPGAREHLEAVQTAISRTIELTCEVRHPGVSRDGNYRIVPDPSPLYCEFWQGLLRHAGAGQTLPTLITFNYDLVLERALLQAVIGTGFHNLDQFGGKDFLRINYHHPRIPKLVYQIVRARFNSGTSFLDGLALRDVGPEAAGDELAVEILKLHGSLNFPRNGAAAPTRETYNVAQALAHPQILPPIFNKHADDSLNEVWKVALQRLRSAKNVIIVGYSLPSTDIYMQYFMKSALGPNLLLNKIFVYNPAVAEMAPAAAEARQRYETCFSAQLRSRIDFSPPSALRHSTAPLPRTTVDFVRTIASEPRSILF